MRKWLGRICALLVIAALVVVPMSSMACEQPPPPPPPCVKLWAGQDTLAATVTIEEDSSGNLDFCFDMQGDWKVYEIHIQVESDWMYIPHNKKGNLQPGKFEFTMSYSGTGDFCVEFPEALTPGTGDYFIVLHAVVSDGDSWETGWINKCTEMDYYGDLSGGSGWATYYWFYR